MNDNNKRYVIKIWKGDKIIIFDVIPWTRKNKKYDVYKDNKYILWFGDVRYSHYYDKIGTYKDLNHNDEKRKEAYYKRHGLTDDIYWAKWWSNNILW